MSLAFASRVALRYSRSRKGFVSVITGFSLVGIALGVAALIVVMAVMSGFRAELTQRILGTTGHAQLTTQNLTLERAQIMADELMKVNGVTRVMPFVGGQTMVVGPRRTLGAMVRGLQVEDIKSNALLMKKLPADALDSFADQKKVLLGQELALSLGVTVGDRINILSPQGSQTIMGFIPRMMQVTVGGVFEIGMYQYDSGLIVMPLPLAQTFFKFGDLISALEVDVREPLQVNNYAETFQNIAGPFGRVNTWVASNQQFFEALQVEKVTMFIILTLIVLVAAFNIITGQMMSVSQKRRDIAILRTMGARRIDITRVFFLSGFLIGFIGTIAGLILGLLVVFNLQNIVNIVESLTGAEVFSSQVYFLSRLPAVVVPEDVAMVVLMSLLLALVAALFPAWRATRLDPVEALRNE